LEYEKIRHEIERILTSYITSTQVDEYISSVKNRWDSLKTLYVNERHYNEARKKVKSFNKYPKELDFISDKKTTTENGE